MDLRLAFRSVRRRTAVSSAVVGAVALAVAITTALFSVLDGLLFRPLPFHDPDRLVAVDYRLVDGRLPELVYVRELASRREALREAVERSPLIAGAAQAGFATFFDPDEARDLAIEVHGVDARLLPLLGLSPQLGVGFSVDDERSPAALSRMARDPLPVIIGFDLWRRLYGADPGVLGVRELAGRSVRIVGVMAAGVKFPGETNVWAPVPSTRARPPTYVRLAPEATIEQLASIFPELQFTPLREAMHVGESRALPMLFGAAGLLLIVTWVQVAALMFSGSLGQIHEVGVRLALGARRAHLVRQRAIESALLAAAAFTIAWLAVRPLTAFVVNVLPAELRHGQYLSPDLRAFAFGCAISLLGFFLLTLAPLGAVGRVSPLGLLNRRVADARFRVERWRFAVLVGQMTLTGLLLYLSGLAVHSFVQASSFDYGFDAENVLIFTPPPWAGLNATNEQLVAGFAEHNRKGRESVEVLQNIPGVWHSAVWVGSIGRGNATGPGSHQVCQRLATGRGAGARKLCRCRFRTRVRRNDGRWQELR